MEIRLTCYIFIFLGVTFGGGSTTPTVVKLGGIFYKEWKLPKLAFEFAIHQLNKQQQEVEFVPHIVDVINVFDASKKARKLLNINRNSSLPGVAGVFVAADQAIVDLTASFCREICMPLIHPLPDLNYKRQHGEADNLLGMHLHPDVKVLSSALLSFAEKFQWRNIVVLYSGTEGLNRVKSVLNAGLVQSRFHANRELIFWPMADMEKTLKDLRYNVPYRQIIVDINSHDIPGFIKAANDMKMLTPYHHYMFTSLDLAAVKVDSAYTSGGVNITGFRVLDSNSETSKNVLQDFIKSNADPGDVDMSSLLEAHPSLVIDAVQMYGRAIKDELAATGFNKMEDRKCWENGRHIYDRMANASYEGLTGEIKLTGGRRQDFNLELIEYDVSGEVRVVGNWNVANGLNITKSEQQRREDIQKDLHNKTLRVVVKVEEPFIMRIPGAGNNSREFEGFAIDMLNQIAQNLNLTYEEYEVPDGTTGLKLKNGSWTGMIGALIKNDADLALGELTINYERSSVIDFTKPFMNMGISILFKKPEPRPPKLFSFLEPFDDPIWMCMIGAYAFVSLSLFAVARFSPYEWKNPHPCNPESDTLENEFTMMNSFWFTIGSLMLQGSEVAPKASSTRIIAGVWSFFTLILISSYTANLAAFLTITRMSTPIQNAVDLSKQTAIKYGCQYGGSTYRFFQKAKIPTYEKMWNFMSQNEDVFVNKSEMGIAKVKGGKYAYLMESTALRYQLSKHCDLMEVGEELDSKGYGIGLPKHSPYRDIISKEILKLSESQDLLRLYNKWWNVKADCDRAEDSSSSASAAQLGMDNLGGVFVFLVGGLALALLIALLEFVVNAVVNSKTDKQDLCAELAEECKFAVNFCGPSKKPTRLLPVKVAKKLMFNWGD